LEDFLECLWEDLEDFLFFLSFLLGEDEREEPVSLAEEEPELGSSGGTPPEDLDLDFVFLAAGLH
jgi:hypothetical protein